MFRKFLTAAAVLVGCFWATAQKPDIHLHEIIVDGEHEYELIDTLNEVVDVAPDHLHVITNTWHHNIFAFFDAGANCFWGDETHGSLYSRMTPQFNIGVGKWFTPGFGVKLQFTGFNSRANKYVQGLYTRGVKTFYDKDGKPYWHERIKWWDLSINGILNFNRLIKGYEFDNVHANMNQFLLSFGIGATHHMNLPYGSANEWSGHLELQYSHFFTDAKACSFDVKLRGLFYETKYDGVFNHGTFDYNISLNLGFTYYFKERGWGHTVTNVSKVYEDHHHVSLLNDEINRLRHEARNRPKEVRVDTIYLPSALANSSTAANMVTFPYLVNFVIDKVEVVNRERVNLRTVAEMIKATPNLRYLVCGYADKHTGSVERNIWLAKHRADNVYKILVEEFGVPAKQLIRDDKGGVENMYYDDPQLSRSAIISVYKE